jgi:hypothetical protein
MKQKTNEKFSDNKLDAGIKLNCGDLGLTQ